MWDWLLVFFKYWIILGFFIVNFVLLFLGIIKILGKIFLVKCILVLNCILCLFEGFIEFNEISLGGL